MRSCPRRLPWRHRRSPASNQDLQLTLQTRIGSAMRSRSSTTNRLLPLPVPRVARQSAPQLSEETAEYDVELEHRHAEGEQGEDMLEETPEFLQDAPDHDRLWFEQRPPRDFDFDG